MELKGARVLLTGASRGIGRALAAALREEGCDLIAVARAAGDDVESCDVTQPDQVAALFDRVGPVDLLINNAGVIHEPAPLVDIPLSEWRRLFETNVFGMVDLCRTWVPSMNERGSGVVVNLSSTWGRVSAGHQSPYCATKFAVEALSAALAEEVAPGVVVVSLNPGVVATEMLATAFASDVSMYTSPEQCAADFVQMLRRVDVSWNGRAASL
jgi:NAD(P)-dependent dehydrogenase (short-subunit alcohol dehydrogenase family)